MKINVVRRGKRGLTFAGDLHAPGIQGGIYESASEIRPLGVCSKIQPQDSLDRWTLVRINVLEDVALPIVPRGPSRAREGSEDASALRDELLAISDLAAAWAAGETRRRPATPEVVRRNRCQLVDGAVLREVWERTDDRSCTHLTGVMTVDGLAAISEGCVSAGVSLEDPLLVAGPR